MLQMDIVESVMKDCGWNPAHKGTMYLRDAVGFCDLTGGICEIYQAVAEKRGTTASRVERAIRHATERVFERGSMEDLRQWFGGQIDCRTGKMTNSAVICSLWHIAGGDDD